jgi:hypothetical protein
MFCCSRSVRTLALSVLPFVVLPLAAKADAPPSAQAVLAQEKRWIEATASHDVRTLGGILAHDFVHVTYRGQLRYRDDALTSIMKPRPYTEQLSEQTVDFAGSVAIVHGVNVVTQSGKVVLRLRYTDVFAKRDGIWVAISAQETPIVPN